MSKLSKATDFSKRERERIKARDQYCIFCKMGYHMNECRDSYLFRMQEIMHYIPRSHQGLGIAQNAALGCKFHHEMLDNGNKGRREEMLKLFREYLQRHYKDWNEEDLRYRKYNF